MVHRHSRSLSQEMNFVIDFANGGPPSPEENKLRVLGGSSFDPGSEFSCSKGLSNSMSLPNGSNGSAETVPDEAVPHEAKAVNGEAKAANRETKAATPEAQNGRGDIHMSLVSPPFTPSASDVDLVAAGPSQSSELDSDPLNLSSSETRKLRSRLDEELPIVFCESRARIPTTNGTEIFLHVYSNNKDNKEHLAIVFGNDIHSKTLFAPREGESEYDRMTRGAYTGTLYPGRLTSTDESERPADKPAKADRKADVLCRIHSECYTGETAWSARCDCGEQLDEAARIMAEEGRGVIVYLRQEGRGIGLGEKLKAYNLQDLGADTVQANLMLRHPADGRSFGLATAILKDLGLDRIRLMTNNPDKIVAVEGKHKEITVTQRVPMIPLSWQNKGGFRSEEVDKYLSTKAERMGHLLERTNLK